MSPLIQQLLAALEAGDVTKFSDLPIEQVEALKAEFVVPFTVEQREVLLGLMFDATGRLADIDAINASSPINKMGVRLLVDNTPVLPVSLITWARPGEGFAPAYDLLLSLPVRQVTSADWPESEE